MPNSCQLQGLAAIAGIAESSVAIAVIPVSYRSAASPGSDDHSSNCEAGAEFRTVKSPWRAVWEFFLSWYPHHRLAPFLPNLTCRPQVLLTRASWQCSSPPSSCTPSTYPSSSQTPKWRTISISASTRYGSAPVVSDSLAFGSEHRQHSKRYPVLFPSHWQTP